MAETFNPIISHLYSGQGGVSREITKYDNTTISEINFKESGVTTKYDFGGLFNEKMFTGNRVWNQLVQNGNFVDDSGWSFNAATHSVASNTLSVTATAQYGNTVKSNLNLVNGHKYLLTFLHKGTTGGFSIYTNTSEYFGDVLTNATDSSFAFKGAIVSYTKTSGTASLIFQDNRASDWTEQQFKNIQLFDLTLIYGAGNEPTTVAEFVHDYPELYYPYDAGTNFSLATKLFNTIKQPLNSIKFYGNTMRWCQLVKNGNFVDTSAWSNPLRGTFAVNNGVGVFTVTEPQRWFDCRARQYYENFVSGHKYYVSAKLRSSSAIRCGIAISNTSVIISPTANTWTQISSFVTLSSTIGNEITFGYEDLPSIGDTLECKEYNVFDLTYIFGAGNEPTTVSDFTRRLKKLYYPFTDGEILSIEKASEYLYGINIWDEEWEVGTIGWNGSNSTSSTNIRSKNYIRVLGGETYYVKIAEARMEVFYYDANKTFISYEISSVANQTVTVPANACFLRFYTQDAYGTTYNNDICINLSDSSINGTYEASKGEQKMQLDSFNLWDEQWEVGTINTTNGDNSSSTVSLRSKNHIPAVDGTIYYCKSPISTTAVYYYDGNKSFIGYEANKGNTTFTTPSSCSFVRFVAPNYISTYTTYNNDICINLSDPSRNGIYVPYRRYVELNGINDAVDTVTVEKNATLPFGLVDLGSLEWSQYAAVQHRFHATLPGVQRISTEDILNAACGLYEVLRTKYSGTSLGNRGIFKIRDGGGENDEIAIDDPAFSDTTSLINYLKGQYFYYELAGYPLNGTPILAGSYVRKIEKVDLGTLSWSKLSSGIFYADPTVAQKLQTENYNCAEYSPFAGSWDSLPNKSITGHGGVGEAIWVRDDAYADATAFKAAVNGVMLYYELATPVETTLTAQQCAEILNGAFTKSKYSTLLTDNDNGQIDQTVDVGMWEQR